MPLLDVEDTILKLLGMQALSVSGCQQEGNQVLMFLRKKGGLVCPRCHKEHDGPVRDSQIRQYKCGLINSYPILARITIRRFFCPNCQILVREDVGLPEDKVSSLPVLNEFVSVLSEMMDNKAVAKLTGLSEASVFRIDKANLQKRMLGYQDHVPPLEYVSVDEIAIRRGHNYCTVAVNLKAKKIIWIEPERKKDSLYKLMQHFPEQFSQVKALSMDLWQPYELAAKEFCPQAHIVYDKFHISRLLGRCIEFERRSYQKQLAKDDRKYLKKHIRWLLLKRRYNLTPIQFDKLEELKKFNLPMYEMYLLKEMFLSIFDKAESVYLATIKIANWIKEVRNTSYEFFHRFADSLVKRMENLLNWFKFPISNGISEGMNNALKALMRRAFGYKDFEYFRLKALQKMGYLYVGTHRF